MKIRMRQGQSYLSTEWKQRGISSAFHLNLTVAKKFPYYPYMHFDLNSGSGYNYEADCIGSPLAFIGKADELGVDNYHAFFIDKDKKIMDILIGREWLRGRQNCYFYNCDNADFVPTIPDILRKFNRNPEMSLGSIFCDPNGTDIPFLELSNFFRDYKRLDIIINWNATSMKRTRKVFGRAMFRIDDLPSLFGKRFWLIREPISVHQFALVVGRNYRFNEHKSLGFYHLDGTRGREISRRLDLTNEERRLFDCEEEVI